MVSLRGHQYIDAAVHTSDRVTIGVDMSIPLSVGEAQETRSRETGLQFVVGRDETGRWVAVEEQSSGGGIFVSRQAALNYAAFEAGRAPGRREALERTAGAVREALRF